MRYLSSQGKRCVFAVMAACGEEGYQIAILAFFFFSFFFSCRPARCASYLTQLLPIFSTVNDFPHH